MVGRSVEAAKRLTHRLNFALVRGLLALGFLNEFEQFIQRLDGVAQGAEHGLRFFDGLADRGGCRGLRGRRQGQPFGPCFAEWLARWAIVMLHARRRSSGVLFVGFGRRLLDGGLLRCGCKKVFFVRRGYFTDFTDGNISTVIGSLLDGGLFGGQLGGQRQLLGGILQGFDRGVGNGVGHASRCGATPAAATAAATGTRRRTRRGGPGTGIRCRGGIGHHVMFR